jgi:hypothetical protein
MAEVLAAVATACPKLAGVVSSEGRVAAHYLLSIDSGPFITDLQQPLEAGARVLLLSADSGG